MWSTINILSNIRVYYVIVNKIRNKLFLLNYVSIKILNWFDMRVLHLKSHAQVSSKNILINNVY